MSVVQTVVEEIFKRNPEIKKFVNIFELESSIYIALNRHIATYNQNFSIDKAHININTMAGVKRHACLAIADHLLKDDRFKLREYPDRCNEYGRDVEEYTVSINVFVD